MAQINRNRLHALVSGLCALLAIAYGLVLLTSVYSAFAKSFINQQQIQNLERRTGKSYAEWQQGQSVQCTKEFAERKEAPEWKDVHYRICMSIPVMELVPDTDVVLEFLAAKGHWVIGYILAGALAAWLAGFLVAKAIPAAASRFWAWITTHEKAQ